jgi:hypothetical protein
LHKRHQEKSRDRENGEQAPYDGSVCHRAEPITPGQNRQNSAIPAVLAFEKDQEASEPAKQDAPRNFAISIGFVWFHDERELSFIQGPPCSCVCPLVCDAFRHRVAVYDGR